MGFQKRVHSFLVSRLASKSQLPLLMFTINIAAGSSISLLDFPTLFFFSFKNRNSANIAGKISQHETESSELIVKNSCPSSVFLITLDPRMKLRNGTSPLQSNCKEVQECQGRTGTLPVQQEAMASPWAAVDTTQSLPWFYLQDRLPLAPFPLKHRVWALSTQQPSQMPTIPCTLLTWQKPNA